MVFHLGVGRDQSGHLLPAPFHIRLEEIGGSIPASVPCIIGCPDEHSVSTDCHAIAEFVFLPGDKRSQPGNLLPSSVRSLLKHVCGPISDPVLPSILGSNDQPVPFGGHRGTELPARFFIRSGQLGRLNPLSLRRALKHVGRSRIGSVDLIVVCANDNTIFVHVDRVAKTVGAPELRSQTSRLLPGTVELSLKDVDHVDVGVAGDGQRVPVQGQRATQALSRGCVGKGQLVRLEPGAVGLSPVHVSRAGLRRLGTATERSHYCRVVVDRDRKAKRAPIANLGGCQHARLAMNENGYRRQVRIFVAVVGPVRERVGAEEIGVGRISERSVGLQHERAMGNLIDQYGPERIPIGVGIVGQHTIGRHDQDRSLVDVVVIVFRGRRIIGKAPFHTAKIEAALLFVGDHDDRMVPVAAGIRGHGAFFNGLPHHIGARFDARE